MSSYIPGVTNWWSDTWTFLKNIRTYVLSSRDLLSTIASLDSDIKNYLAAYECSGELTSGGIVKSGAGIFGGIIIATNGADDVTVKLYDNTIASGKRIIPRIVVTSTNNYGGILIPVKLYSGICLSLSGTGAKCVIYHK